MGVSARRNLLFGSDAAADGALEARGIGEKGGLFGNGGDGGAGEDEKRARSFFVEKAAREEGVMVGMLSLSVMSVDEDLVLGVVIIPLL